MPRSRRRDPAARQHSPGRASTRVSRRTRASGVSISSRKSKVAVADFSPGVLPHLRCAEVQRLFPDILAGYDFKRLVQAIVEARRKDHRVLFMMGGHVVKTGVSPLVIQMLSKGALTAVAMNGAAAIHDVEIAMWGKTSEDVEEALRDGTFGMTVETSSFMNTAIIEGHERKEGMGVSLGRALNRAGAPYAEKSILSYCQKKRIPLTVHVSIGTDVIHQHPLASGQAIGETSMSDFRLLTSIVEDIKGGVVLNVGSAVILPEVFLKALAVARSKGVEYWPITTANMDSIQHYRPLRNVVERPVRVGRGSVGIALTGHHEIMIPLLAVSVLGLMSR